MTTEELPTTVDEAVAEAASSISGKITDCCGLVRCMITKANGPLKLCGGCGEIAYCCVEHQSEHFKEGGHKMICKGNKTKKPLTFEDCYNKANSFHQQSMFVASLPYWSAMIELTERSAGIFHSQVGKALEPIIYCYRQAKKYDHAIQCLQRNIFITEMDHDDSPAANDAAFQKSGLLAELYIRANKFPVAKAILEKTIEMASEVYGPDSFEVGRMHISLASCEYNMGNAAIAEELILKILKWDSFISCIQAKQTEENIGNRMICYNAYYNLAMLQREELKKYSESIESFKAAVAINGSEKDAIYAEIDKIKQQHKL